MSLRTPISKVRGLGSAKNGTHHWWMQKVTTVALVPLTLWFVYLVLRMANSGYDAALSLMSHPIHASLMVIFLTVGLYHLKLGLQVVVEDYIPNHKTKIFSLMMISFACVVVGVISVLSVIKIAL